MSKINHQQFIKNLDTDRDRAMKEIYECYGTFMKAAAKSVLKSDDGADDVIQEVLMDFWKNWEYRDVQDPKSYLIQAVYNKAKSLLTRRVREGVNKREYAKVIPINSVNAASRLKRMKQLEKNLEKMPEGIDRKIFDRLIDGLSHEDIATELNVKIPHVKYVRTKYITILKAMISDKNNK